MRSLSSRVQGQGGRFYEFIVIEMVRMETKLRRHLHQQLMAPTYCSLTFKFNSHPRQRRDVNNPKPACAFRMSGPRSRVPKRIRSTSARNFAVGDEEAAGFRLLDQRPRLYICRNPVGTLQLSRSRPGRECASIANSFPPGQSQRDMPFAETKPPSLDASSRGLAIL